MKKVFYTLISSCLAIYSTTAFAQIPYYIPIDSLVAWYPFNNNANDESGNGHNGIANGSTIITTDRCEVPNSAYYFNGQTSQITIPDALYNGGWNSHTICCWINSDTLLNPYSNANNQCIINTYPHRGEAISFCYNGSNKYSFFAGSNPPAAVWDMFSGASSETNATAHIWNHVAMVKEGTSYSMYINGILDTVFQTSIVAVNYYCSLVIGNISQYAVETFYGKLDDFGIWNRALTDSEIFIIYNAPCVSASFSSSQTNVCEKFCVNFYDSTGNNATSWQWIFEGGVPFTSTEQNPSNICYDFPGAYDVTLITTNANGVDTLYKPDYITVNATPPIPVITQVGYTLTSSAADFYQWQFNIVDIPGATDQSYEVTETGYYTVVTSDVNGCVSSATLYVVITSIENIFSDQYISITPNPARDHFTIALSMPVNGNSSAIITITDVSGKQILQQESSLNQGKLTEEILLSKKFSAGSYLIHIKVGDVVFTRPLSVQR